MSAQEESGGREVALRSRLRLIMFSKMESCISLVHGLITTAILVAGLLAGMSAAAQMPVNGWNWLNDVRSASYRTLRPGTSETGILAQINSEGAQGYWYAGDYCFGSACSDRVALYVRNEGRSANYTSKSLTSPSSSQSFLSQANSEGGRGYQFRGEYCFNSTCSSRGTIYTRDASSSELYSYRVQASASSSTSFVAQATTEGGAGYVFFGDYCLGSTCSDPWAIYVRLGSHAATFSYRALTPATSASSFISQANAEGAGGFWFGGELCFGSSCSDRRAIYVKDGARNTTFSYKALVPASSSTGFLAQVNAEGSAGYLFMGEYCFGNNCTDRRALYVKLGSGGGNACTYSISTSSASISSGAGSGSFGVTAPAGCTWSAQSNVPWISTTSSGVGSGTVSYTVAANSGVARTGTVLVAGQTFTITQQAGTVAAATNYTGLWYNFPAESEAGWGINFTHQGNIVFATLFTYDASGAPLWLVMAAGNLASGTTYSGTLYRTRGPAFNAVPFTWNPTSDLNAVGTMTVTFAASDRAALSYTYNGVAVSKTIMKQVYGARAANCTSNTGSRANIVNYQDLWYASPAESEPGWGINITHQDSTLFATLFTYDATGRDLWLVMSSGQRQPDGSFVGTLYKTSGPAFNANPFSPIGAGNLSNVGTMRLSFTNGENGTLSYTFNGVSVTKAITRQVFSSPVSACN